jgi:uncharacterized protein
MLLVFLIMGGPLSSTAAAIDCAAAASSAMDKAICANPELRKADNAMSSAYSAVFRAGLSTKSSARATATLC